MTTTMNNGTQIIMNATAEEANAFLVENLPDNDDAIIVRNERSAQFCVYLAAASGYLNALRYMRNNSGTRENVSRYTLAYANLAAVAGALVETGCVLADGSIGHNA